MLVDEDELKKYVFSAINEALANKIEVRDHETYLTTKEVAEMLGVSTCTLWRWNKSGYLCYVKCGRKSFYKKSDIDKLISGNGKLG